MSREKIRFVVAGGSTTLFSYALYAALLFIDCPASGAYAIAYVAGIGWSYVINSMWVFKAPMSIGGFLKFPLVYVIQAAASFALFRLLHEVMGVDTLLVPLLIAAVMIPLTYVVTRFILVSRRPKPHAD